MPTDPSVLAGILRRPFAEQVAFFRGRLRELVPTARWDDIERAAHDTAFMVAGAAKADLLSDLAAAVDRAVTEGRGLEEFRRDFRDIVERNGWHGWTGEGTTAGEAWRTRVIYRTNASTSYAGARWAQLVEGGFPLIVYRHGGSREPRPQHLAWDGLVLPVDHPFWVTHAPPNGWGCSCYVLGARSAAGARRLGGDPDKTLPPGWDAADPRTGAPPGIDRGWDYAPGASVARTVATTAEKIRHWDHQVAKAFMEHLRPELRDALATSHRRLPSVAGDARRYAERVIGERGGGDIVGAAIEPARTLGPVTSRQAERIGPLVGVDITAFDFSVSRDEIRHVQAKHGAEARERPRGQRAVTPADYARLPELVNSPDRIDWAGKTDTGRPAVQFVKRFGGETWTAIFELRTGRRTLALTTLWIRVGS